MHKNRLRIAVLIAFLCLPAIARAQGNGNRALTARIAGNSIVAEGATPNQELLLFGVTLEEKLYETTRRAWHRLAKDDDGDGTVLYAFDAGIAPKSIWAVIDPRSGDYVIVTPAGFEPPRQVVAEGKFHRGEKRDEVVAVDLAGRAAEVVVIRGGAGAWSLTIDQDGGNDALHDRGGVMRLDPSKMLAVAGNAPPPKVLTPGDLVLSIDPYTFEFSAGRIAR